MRSIAVEHTLTLNSKMQTLTPSQSLNGPPRYDAAEYPAEYKVEKLLGHRKAGRGNGNEYLVRWSGKDMATAPPTPWPCSPPPSHPTLFLMLIVLTAHHFHASNSPCVRRTVDFKA